jgi:protein involved in polysaccharide export with SLBB domain
MRGDTGNDAKLLPGDVVFVPPVGATATVDGEVRRPAIYELKGDVDVAEIVQLAGGLTADADNSRVALLRVNEQRKRVVLDVPLASAEGRKTRLHNGDSLRVLRLRPTLDSGIAVEGHVFRPGVVAWHEGLRISDVLPSVDELKPNADLGYVLIRRELPPDRRIAVLSADLSAALRAPGSQADTLMSPHDRVIIFDAESSRREVVDPLLDELKRQARLDHPSELVRVDGRVKAPGEYPLESGMRVSDLLRAGGSLEDSAYGAKAQLTRYKVVGDIRQTELLSIDLAAVRRGDASADVLLQPFDFLTIQETPEWRELEQVTLRGEVRFPGTYPIKRGETLRSVLERAGGLTPLAFPSASIFTRKELRDREQEQLERLAERLQTDLASSALQATQAKDSQAGQALTIGQSLLAQLKTTKPVGRLVIDLERVLAQRAGSAADVALRDGDQLLVPKIRQEVTVLGEVQNSTSHLFRPSLTRDDYIALSGGTTRKADRKHIYVVRADGSVVGNVHSGWFRRSGQVTIKPGDTVVVPLDTERMPTLPLWQAVTQIMYNIAIAATAIKNL